MILPHQRLAKWWDALRSSYWFVPGLFVLGAGALAAVLVRVDHEGLVRPESLPIWIRVGEQDAARAVLTTIATAMISIVTLTFSITIVALTLASSQYGPRLLYNFMRDRQNQIVLGVLLGTFVYSLLVLVSVRSDDDLALPQLAVIGAIVLSLTSVGALILFLHHIAEKMQAPNVVAGVGRELAGVMRRNLPDGEDESAGDAERPAGGIPVCVTRTGILQAIDGDALAEAARCQGVEVWLARRPGDYVFEGSVVMHAHGAARLSEEALRKLADTLTLGSRRTLVQDVEFAFNQLVEVAVRALSPGINDPFTAMSCIDELANGLLRVARSGPLTTQFADDEGRVRVHLEVIDFESTVRIAYDQIRRQAQRNLVVMIHLLETLARMAPLVRSDAQREALRRQGRLTLEIAVRSAETGDDERALEERFGALERALESVAGASAS